MSKTILMIHGFGAAGESWAPVAARFKAAGYAVETPTIQAALRTVGPPPAGLAGKTLADFVAEMSDLAQSIAKADGEKPVVFGHSMGGLIAQKLAEAGLASGVVLFAPASPAHARGKPKLSPVFTFLNIALTAKPETKAVKIWKTGFKWGVLNQTPAARHDAIFAATVHDSGRALSDLAYPDRDPNKTVSVDASKVTAPVLILAGARDRTTPIDDVRLVGKKYAGATFKEYADNAHWLIDEPGSDRILAEVETWLGANGLGVTVAVAKAAPAAKPEPAKPAPVPAKPAAKAKAAAKTKPAPAPAVKAAPALESITAAKVAAKPAAKAKPAPASKVAAPVAKAAPVAAPTLATAKVAPAAKAPKAAPAAAKPAKPAPVSVAKAEPVAKPKAVARPAATPVVAKPPAKVAAPKPVAKPRPAPVARAPLVKAPAPAKPAPAPKPAAAKAPAAKAAAKPKPPATKATAKSSPAPKKSV
ncbi:hypothetical protein BH10PSE4_BH10PSE4_43190 [soil metagenome]